MPNFPPSIKILFLHRPSWRALKQRSPEMKWFSGLFTGHVGIEFSPGRVVDFTSSGSLHLWPHRKNPHARFVIRPYEEFRQLLGKDPYAKAPTSLEIPVTATQQQKLHDVITAFTRQPPYDYAFLGMRCASATYDILARAGILPTRPLWYIAFRMFTPGLLKRSLRQETRT
ncbi:MAG: hypothetical protein ACOC30_01945 [Marinilabilia sp.]